MTTVTEREHCPFCGAVTCTYRTTLRPRLVHFIRKLPRDGSYIRARDLCGPTAEKASTDGARLLHWGLVERPDIGVYRLSQAGMNFLAGETAEPAWIETRRNVLVGMSDENLTVGEVMALEDRR